MESTDGGRASPDSDHRHDVIEAQGLKATGVLVSERFVRLGRRL
jgi:hypothetical protein